MHPFDYSGNAAESGGTQLPRFLHCIYFHVVQRAPIVVVFSIIK